VLKIMGSKLEPAILNQAANEIPEQYLSSEKARARLGWKPEWDFDTGLKKTIEWYKQYLKPA